MKIEGVNPTLTQSPTESVTARAPSGGQANTQSVAQDRTSFHSDSTSVQALVSQALKFPQVRQDRVDALRDSVRGDEYQIDSNRLAAAISGAGGK